MPLEPTIGIVGAQATLYYFNDLQTATTREIIQPVLQWRPNFTFSKWEIASWYVSGTNGVHSTPKAVTPGQQLTGITKASSCNSVGACTWTIFTAQGTLNTTLTVSLPNAFTVANQGVLEVWNLDNCVQLSRSPRLTFYENSLFQPLATDVNVNSAVDTLVNWQAIVTPGLPLNCNWGVSRNATENQTQLTWQGF